MNHLQKLERGLKLMRDRDIMEAASRAIPPIKNGEKMNWQGEEVTVYSQGMTEGIYFVDLLMKDGRIHSIPIQWLKENA